MLALEYKPTGFDSLFSLMDKCNAVENNDVNLLDIQKNFENYSNRELRSLTNMLVNAYHGIYNEKYSLFSFNLNKTLFHQEFMIQKLF